MTMKSEEITTLNMAPGVFGSDDGNARWNKPTNDRFWGWNFHHAKAGSLENIKVRNMDNGDQISLGGFSGHDYTRVSGTDYLFSATSANSGLQSSGTSSGRCFQIYDQHLMDISAGVFIGTLTGHDDNVRARWLRDVIGVQFQWTDKNTDRENNDGLKLISLYLMYMDSQYGIMQYAPVINGGYVGDHYNCGDDPAAKYWGGKVAGTSVDKVNGNTCGPNRSRSIGAGTSGFGIGSAIQHNGRVIAYVSNKSIEYIQSRNMFCVGMWWSTQPKGSQGANYDRVWDIFNFKLLTSKDHMFSSDSKMIIPPLRTMNEAMYDSQFPLAHTLR